MWGADAIEQSAVFLRSLGCRLKTESVFTTTVDPT
ncbi:MAG: hypothetical protein BWY17_00180 [Deltaproteobacteria bacterium ADurb.Bin207]|jgi:hypothetical protein|nr:MAG: hypothetical protein BWY17_00180 [Deltaproteobacteria bacterium ADurb.Bin207]